jgi:phosphatidylethanolamine-binding protein (PEBP) family uncharacterized protein
MKVRLFPSSVVTTLSVVVLLGVVPSSPSVVAQGTLTPANQPFTITSPAFTNYGPLPTSSAYSQCGGQNLAPALSWTNVPAATKSFAFAVVDVSAPIAGGFIHWVATTSPVRPASWPATGRTPTAKAPTTTQVSGMTGRARRLGVRSMIMCFSCMH